MRTHTCNYKRKTKKTKAHSRIFNAPEKSDCLTATSAKLSRPTDFLTANRRKIKQKKADFQSGVSAKKSPDLMREFGKKRIADRKSDLWQQADETAEKSAAHFPNGAAQPRDLILAQRQKISQKCADFADALIFRQISSVHPGEKTQVLGK